MVSPLELSLAAARGDQGREIGGHVVRDRADRSLGKWGMKNCSFVDLDCSARAQL